MQLVKPRFTILNEEHVVSVLGLIEKAGRTCYQSDCGHTQTSCEEFITKLARKGHMSVLEHSLLSVEFICDRGVSHELVRHRLAAFSQESQRYCNYLKDKFGAEIKMITPFFFDPSEPLKPVNPPLFACQQASEDFSRYSLEMSEQTHFMNSFDVWMYSCLMAEWAYMTLTTTFERSAQEARAVLPNSTKTSIVVTANFREWLHILLLRACDKTGAAHPQMKQLMVPLLAKLQSLAPCVFGLLTIPEHNKKYLEG